jgi:hypothetical protein
MREVFVQVEVKVFIPDHAQERIQQRGGVTSSIAAATKRAARRVGPQLRRRCRLAVDAHDVPEVIPVVLIRPPRDGDGPVRAVVKTVLPPGAPSLKHMEVIHV